MKTMTVKIIKTCMAGLLALCILSFFLLVYDYTGIHVTNSSGATDYKWMPRQLKTTMTEGFAWMRFDENGFNNPDGISLASVDVLLMGSSHLEGVHVSKEQGVASELRNRITEFSIYNIGTSGHTIYHCAQNLSAAVQEYHPQKYVVIETNVALPDTASMLEVLNDELKDIPSYDSGALFYLQKYCPALKSLYKNVQDWARSEKGSSLPPMDNGESENGSAVSCDKAVLSRFLAKMRKDCGDRKLIILYHPQSSIDERGELSVTEGKAAMFSEACAENDIIFVDVTEDFCALYHDHHRLAYGFTNTAVGQGHLNEYGCEVIAERLAQVIKEDQKNELK